MSVPVAAPVELALVETAGRRAAATAQGGQLLELLYRQVRSLAGPTPELDDLVQLAAERALRGLPNFDGRSALSTWTYGIAYRTIVDQGRWWRRWHRRFELWDDGRAPEPGQVMGGEEAVLQLRRARRVHEALRQLPPAKRAALVMHDLEGLPLQDVAMIAGTNERTVRSRLRDGRRKLADLLRDDPLFRLEKEEP